MNNTFIALVLIVVLYPLYFVIIASVSDPQMVYAGKVTLFPRGISLEGYERLFRDDTIMVGYRNSVLVTLAGTSVSVFVTVTAAFALTNRQLKGKNLIVALVAFTMFFNGGLIPTYLVVKNLGLLNSFWALILPNAVWPWNLFIVRTFYTLSIPKDLEEAATIDGASITVYFYRIVLPLSKAIISVMILYYGVAYWNLFFQALIYLSDEHKFPLQLILRNILIENQSPGMAAEDAADLVERLKMADLIKYSSIVVASVPLMILYPFLQKYFIQGIMIGSIKG